MRMRPYGENMAVYMDSSDGSDDDALIFIEFLDDLYPKKKREIRPRLNPFEDYDEEKFKARFRLRKATILQLLTQIEDQLEYRSDRNQSVSPINQLLITLRFYATGTFQMVNDEFGVDRSTVCRTIHKVTNVIASLSAKYVKFPASRAERRREMYQFFVSSKFPHVIGAVDCMHVPIHWIGKDEFEAYRNGQGHFSINVQLVCDHQLYITDVVARWPGSVHDSTIFDSSHLCAAFDTGEISEGYLVGDEGYTCRTYFMTPISEPETPGERDYNEALTSAKSHIQRAIKVMKRRFPALRYGLRLKIENIPPVIVAIVICHNIALGAGEDDAPHDAELEKFIERQRKRGVQVDFGDVDVPPPPQMVHPGAMGIRNALVNGYFSQ